MAMLFAMVLPMVMGMASFVAKRRSWSHLARGNSDRHSCLAAAHPHIRDPNSFLRTDLSPVTPYTQLIYTLYYAAMNPDALTPENAPQQLLYVERPQLARAQSPGQLPRQPLTAIPRCCEFSTSTQSRRVTHTSYTRNALDRR